MPVQRGFFMSVILTHYSILILPEITKSSVSITKSEVSDTTPSATMLSQSNRITNHPMRWKNINLTTTTLGSEENTARCQAVSQKTGVVSHPTRISNTIPVGRDRNPRRVQSLRVDLFFSDKFMPHFK